MKSISNMIEDVLKCIKDIEERKLIKACEENAFIVGNVELKHKLEGMLPENATIFVDSRLETTKIFMIKKFEINLK